MNFRNTALHQYRVEKRIGKGGQGSLYKVIKEAGKNTWCALKILTNSDYIKLFEREAFILEKLQHKNIVPVYDKSLDEHQGEAYILMKYMNQGNIFDYVQKNKDVLLEEKVVLIQDVVEGLEYAHEQDIIHRDIKPENILVHKEDERSYACLADFGIAKNTLEGTASVTGRDMLSLYYLPRECIDDMSTKRTTQHDIYSLGVTMYEILALKHPYGKQYIEFASRIASPDEPLPLSYYIEVPSRLDEVCLKAIHKDPKQRYTSIKEFKHDMQKVAEVLQPKTSIISSITNDVQSHKTSIEDEDDSLIFLAHSYFNGTEEVEQDYGKAKELYEQLAEKGNSGAMYSLGFMLRYGLGGDVDYEQAIAWYKKAGEKKEHVDIMMTLGKIYYDGEKVDKDYREAKEWYEQAVEEGENEALCYLGSIYEYGGNGVEKNYELAIEYYEKALQQGNSNGLDRLKSMYGIIEGSENIIIKFKELYTKAFIQQDDFVLMSELAARYNTGWSYEWEDELITLEQDESKVVQLYRFAAEKGYAPAMSKTGMMYEKGHGVKQSYEEAKRWYERSAQVGESDGMVCLGMIYEQGKGVDIDIVRAKEWYEKSTLLGNIEGYSSLGRLYERGSEHIPKSYIKAIECYEKIIENGDQGRGELYLQEMYKLSKYGQAKMMIKGRGASMLRMIGTLYKQAYVELNFNSLNRLGDMYQYGAGVLKQDLERQKKFMNMR